MVIQEHTESVWGDESRLGRLFRPKEKAAQVKRRGPALKAVKSVPAAQNKLMLNEVKQIVRIQ